MTGAGAQLLIAIRTLSRESVWHGQDTARDHSVRFDLADRHQSDVNKAAQAIQNPQTLANDFYL